MFYPSMRRATPKNVANKSPQVRSLIGHGVGRAFARLLSSTIFICYLVGCSNPEHEEKTRAANAQKLFDEQTKEKIKLVANAAAIEADQMAEKNRKECLSAEEKIKSEYINLSAKMKFREAMDTVRPCAEASQKFKPLLIKAEIGFYIQSINDTSIDAQSRLATLNFFEREYPQEAEKVQNLRVKLIEQNIKETKDATRAAQKAEERRRLQEAKHRKNEGVSLGMTPEEVRASNWGRPRSVNRTTGAYGTHEQWVYGGGNYLYFENGVLTTIQN